MTAAEQQPERLLGRPTRLDAIAELERQLASTPKARDPHAHGVLLYRLGVAYAETPAGERDQHLRQALACFDAAAAIFDPRFDPVEHGRVLVAAGAARRSMGAPGAAGALFGRAIELFAGTAGPDETAAALNNLGLARLEDGDRSGALDAFGRALETFDPTTDDGRRGRAAALLNRGLAHAAEGTVQGFDAALADYAAAVALVTVDEAPMHVGLVHHSAGVVHLSLAGRDPDHRVAHLASAVTSLRAALDVFERTTFPIHHAITSYDLGLAWVASGERRRGLVCFEDALMSLDPRTHRSQWEQAHRSVTTVEAELAEHHPGLGRVDHLVALAAELEGPEQEALIRGRMARLLELPGPARQARLSELAVAVAALPADAARALLAAQLRVLMELPGDALEATLDAWVDARAQLDAASREEGDRIVQLAVGEALGGPQRVLVRDRLASLGFERP